MMALAPFTKVVLVAALAIYTQSAGALTYEWPVTENVDVEITGSMSAKYTLHIGKVTVNDPSLSSTISVRNYVLRTGGIEATNFRFVAYHRHNAALAPEGVYSNLRSITGSYSFVSLAETLTSQYANTTVTASHANAANGNECVGTGLVDYNLSASGSKWAEFYSKVWNAGSVGSAGWQCLGTPPVNEWCALTEPVITLNFGSQTLQNAQSSSASASTKVECTTGMKYTLRLRGANSIPLANGMEARLTANSHALGATLDGEAGLNAVTLSATLDGTPQSGSLAGTGVLFVSYP